MRFSALLITILVFSLLTACTNPETPELVAEVDEPHYRRGKQLIREGREQEALSSFLRVIDKRRGDAPESHLEAGNLFLRHIRDPIESIHHFRRFLELRPNSDQAPLVRQLIETATKEFARNLPARLMENQVDRLDLLELVESLQAENLTLKRDLASAREELHRIKNTAPQRVLGFDPDRTPLQPGGTVQSQPESGEPAESGTPGRYTVVSGDTLTRISAKVYGTSARWNEIFEANRNLLSDPNDLKIGMELVIP